MRDESSDAGFTLIEVLVAFAIAALALVSILEIFSTGLRSMAQSEAYSEAVLLAESKMATFGIEAPVATGEETGRFDDRFRWRRIVRLADRQISARAEEGDLRAYDIVLIVSWGRRDAERSVSLATTRFFPSE